MTDVDYKIFENDRTGTLHLAIHIPGGVERTTICGINMLDHDFRHKVMKLSIFWRHTMRCLNCDKGAKR